MGPTPPPPMPPMTSPAPKEIEIFSLEQLNVLSEEAKTSIIELSNNLPSKELLVLNPLVAKLLKIKELTKIQFVPLPEDATKEQKEAHKASIEEFKDAKKQIVELKKQNGEAKSAIKKPLDLLGKQVLTIEKSIEKIGKEVLDEIEKTFKPYIDDEAAKAKAKADAKTEKANEAINALSEENKAQANTFKKSTLITFLKYEMLTETKTEVSNAIDNYALDNLFAVRNGLSLKTFETLSAGKELDLLNEEELKNIKELFTKEIEQLTKNINVKITALQLEKTNEKLSDTVEQQTEQLEAVKTPPPPVPSFANVFSNSPQGFASGAVPLAPPVPVQSGTPISNTDVFDLMTNANGAPYGVGANGNNVPIKVDIYPKNHNEVDFLDLVIGQLEQCKDNIEYIRKRFMEDTNIEKTEQDKINIEKVRGVKFLTDKTIDYILGKPFKEQ